MLSDLPAWFPRSTFGLIVSILYIALATTVVIIDRKEQGGGFITLHGMISYLATLPISALGDFLGIKPDFRRATDMLFAITGTALIVYFVAAGAAKLVRMAVASLAG